MNSVEFLTKVLPSQGIYALAAFPDGLKAKPKHKRCKTIVQLARYAEHYDHLNVNVYHACATYAEPKIWDERKGRWRFRVASNAAWVRSQWLDIDVGEGKDYPTRKAALAALRALCADAKIPAPMIVGSGRGLHCYWVFDRDISADEAGPRMRAFSELLRQHEFKHDASRTTDLASILRPVGTHHYKAAPRLVELLRDAAPVDPDKFYARLPKVLEAAAAPAVGDPDDEWKSGTRDFPPSSAKRISGRCRAFHDAAKARGNIEEPYWRTMLGLVKFTEEGEQLAHKLSSGHPEYSEGETQDKYDGWEGGPPTCAQFEAVADKCKGCPFKGTIKSPITLGYDEDAPPAKKTRDPAPEPVEGEELKLDDPAHYACLEPEDLPFWPKGYSWDGERLFRFVKDPKTGAGEWVPISNMFYYPFLRYETEDRTRAIKVCALVDVDRNKWRVFDIETTKVAESQALAYALGAHEVLYMPSAKSHNRQYVQDVLYALRESGLETTTYNSFGWHDQGFVVGDQMITNRGEQPVFLGSKVPDVLHNGFGRSGTALEWAELVNEIYNRPGAEPYQFVICAGLAAPLVKLCESDMWHGIPIAITGESGLGKTTTCKVACSPFGDPRKMAIQANDEGTTMKALVQRVATMRNLPLVLDEITGRETAELQGMLFALSNGSPKLRLRSDGSEINPGQQWDTVTFVTGNLSITRMLADSDRAKADATQVRCFEIALEADYNDRVFKGINAKDMIETQLLSRQFGTVGQEFMRFVVRNRQKITNQLQRQRGKYAPSSSEDTRERFYYDLIANVLVAASLAKKLGLIQFDLAAMRRWALNHISAMRVSRKDSLDTPEDYLQAFLAHLHQHTLTTKYFRDGRRKLSDERIMDPPREILARHALEDRRFLVTLSAFKDWCANKRVNPSWLALQLEKSGHVTGPASRQRICKGTHFSGTQANCLEFDYDMLDSAAVQFPDYLQEVKQDGDAD